MQFFHGTNLKLKSGFALEPQSDSYANNSNISELEDFIELYRPKEKIPRGEAVYLSDDADLIDAAGGLTDVIYSVLPSHEPQKSDLAWYTQAAIFLDDGNEFDAAICAQNYWSGLMYTNVDESCFEYRVKEAKILDVFELNVDVAELIELDITKKNNNPHPH